MIRPDFGRSDGDCDKSALPETWGVSLVVPALEEFFLTIRLTTSGVCAKAGMDIECVEDMKTAVAEACYCFVNQSSGCETLELAYTSNPQQTSVVITAQNRKCDPSIREHMKYMPDVAIGILHTLVDGAEVSGDDLGFKQIRLLMRNSMAKNAL